MRDLTLEKFDGFAVLRRAENGPGSRVRWVCLCNCGKEWTAQADNLVSGNTRSCGCHRRRRTGDLFRTHGESKKTPEWSVWCDMRKRCYDRDYKQYADYGGRGITVCDRWRESYENFLTDMGRRPSPQHQLDREKNDGPYSPDNCRWVTRKEQARNKRNNRLITHGGRTQCLAAWAEEIGIGSATLGKRLKAGWDVARALSHPVS